jgi:zinc transport system substrate-binding protein
MKPLNLTLPVALAAALLISCTGEKTDSGGVRDKSIATVNYPLAYFAERLAGDFATIIFDAPADEDPAFWKPGDAEIAKIQGADVILLNGAAYAKWTATASLPEASTTDTSASFRGELIRVKGGDTHAHGEDGEEHSHAGTAFTTWMDLRQAQVQATAVANALKRAFPEREGAIDANREALLADLEALESAMHVATAKLKGAPVIASHPVYQYWERAYGLNVPSLLWEPEMELGPDETADLAEVMEKNPGARFFVWEGEPLPGLVDKVREAGLSSFVVSPCGNRPEEGDFLTVMRANIAAIEALTR